MPAPSYLYTGGAGYAGRRNADAALSASARDATERNKPAAPKFGRRHYEVIAAALASARPTGNSLRNDEATHKEHDIVMQEVADALAKDNPAFNRERFLAACGAPK
jgi:hypothetical protein